MIDEDLTNLDDWVRRLKVEYEIFFNGHRKKPPDDLRVRVDRLVKKLSEAKLSVQERFRYNTLVGRLCVYRDHWRRHMNDMELGRERTEDAQLPRKAHRPPKSPSPRPIDRISISIAHPEKEEAKVRRLYNTLLEIRNRDSKAVPSLSYEQFARYIATQTQGIQHKSGCPSVLFTLSVEEDKVKFTAKAESAPPQNA